MSRERWWVPRNLSFPDFTSISLDEVAAKGHFWPGIMKRESVLDFLARAKARKQDPLAIGFTLTTANPTESGSKGGVRILELELPGRQVLKEISSERDGEADIKLQSELGA